MATADSDASADSSTHDSGVSDSVGPASCALSSDPCFAQFSAETTTAAECMGHPSTCVASVGIDASGCGHRTSPPGGGHVCTWPDGASTFENSDSGGGTNAAGATCYKYTFVATSDGADVTVTFPDGKIFIEHVTASGGSGGSGSLTCPDGTTTRTFTNDEANACKLGVTCCSASTPPSCSG